MVATFEIFVSHPLLSFDLCYLTFFLSFSLMTSTLRLMKSIAFVGEVPTFTWSLQTGLCLLHLEKINDGGYLQEAWGTKLINFIFW